MTVQVIRDLAALRARVGAWRRADPTCRVGVVPTMGALHEGHLSLVRSALAASDRVIVTLFVNPKQFNNPDDLAKYPRTETQDAEKLTALDAAFGTLLLYVPDADTMYPPGFQTGVSVGAVSHGLCGAHRPGHFDGVATVVAKLFLQTGADFGFFGEKDFQQLHVVRRMARDLDIPIAVTGCPTVRDANGLALSSRNLLLSPADRAIAPALARSLFAASRRLAEGAVVARVIADTTNAIAAAGFAQVEYLELRSEDGLLPLSQADQPGRLLVAAWLGGVRLIDNVRVEPFGGVRRLSQGNLSVYT